MAITDFSFAAVNDRNARRAEEAYGRFEPGDGLWPMRRIHPWLPGNEEWYLEGDTWRRMPGSPQWEQKMRAEARR